MNATDTESRLASAVLLFNWFEYCVFCSMLLFSLMIGIYYGWFKKQDTVAEYLLGGKKMGVFPVTMSLTFSHVSGVTLLGIPTEIYLYGTQYIVVYLSNIATLYLVNYFYLPVFYHLQLTSLYEYLELRFNKETRTLASFIFALSLVLFIPLVIYIPALAFNQVTGVSVHVITPIVSLICVFYTSFGGLKAVVWTDTLQSAFTLGSVIFVMILGYLRIGSFSEVIRINRESSRLELFNMNISPFERNTFWSVSIGTTLFWLAQIGVHPGAVQRFIAVSSFKEAKSVMFWSFIAFFVIKGLVTMVGLLMYANYHDCDPIATKAVQQTGQLLPYYVMEVAQEYPGLTGLFISGVLSAALSTMSAGLNTVAGTLYEDFVQFVLKGKRQSEATQAFTLKIIVLVIGLICICMVFIIEKLGSLFQMALSLLGVTNGALVGVFTLGIFIPRANAKGAMAGSLASIVIMSVVMFGAQYYKAKGLLEFPGKLTSVDGCPADLLASLPFNASERVQTYLGLGTPVVADPSVPLIFQVSYMYFVTMGTVIVLLVGVPVSYLTAAQDPGSLDPRLFTPCVRRFLPIATNKPQADEYILVNSNPAPEELKEPSKDNITIGA